MPGERRSVSIRAAHATIDKINSLNGPLPLNAYTLNLYALIPDAEDLVAIRHLTQRRSIEQPHYGRILLADRFDFLKAVREPYLVDVTRGLFNGALGRSDVNHLSIM